MIRSYSTWTRLPWTSCPGELAAAELPGLFARLAKALSIPVGEIEKRVPPKTYRQFQPIQVKAGVTLQTISAIAERKEDFKGVNWHNKPIRSYVESDTLAHVIGYVGDITREELQVLYNKGYAADTTLGKSGVEKQYDDILRGIDGKRFRVVDVKEKGISGADETVVPPKPGLNVVLTIDRKIQRLAEQALGNRNGSVVVLRPATGDVLALVSSPSFDPNRFFAADASDYFTRLTLDPSSPFLDRAIQSAYPPGSTFKVIMTTGIVDDGTIPVNQAVLCTGKLEFGDRVFNAGCGLVTATRTSWGAWRSPATSISGQWATGSGPTRSFPTRVTSVSARSRESTCRGRSTASFPLPSGRKK